MVSFPGTTYEWQVRTVCASGAGAFVPAATTFQTTGSSFCYPPTNLFANNISDTTITLSWTSSIDANSYVVRYRLKNSISWTNAIAPMTQVHNDSIIVPSGIGSYSIPFSMGSPFTYTGNGIYVAFEYANDTNQLSALNTALSTKKNSGIVDQYGADSAQIVLCLNATSNSSLPNLLLTTQSRPQTTFGSSTFVDSVGVIAVYALGHYALNYADTTPVSALIANYASEARDYCVEFKVVELTSGTQRYVESKCITIAPDTSIVVSFNNWVPDIEEINSLIISIPPKSGENVISNNSATYLQTVGPLKLGYDDGAENCLPRWPC